MICRIFLTFLLVCGSASAVIAQEKKQEKKIVLLDANGNLDALIARHASAHDLPEALVRRVIKRESGGNPRAISKGNYGLMQIRLGTARAMGYRGDVSGLLDADTNMTYAVKYLAGAYRTAGGNADRTVHYYAAGYYYAAKKQRIESGSGADGAGNLLNMFDSASARGESGATAASSYSGPGSLNFK